MPTTKKPADMSQEDWEGVKRLPPDMRQSLISLHRKMNKNPAPSLDSIPQSVFSVPVQLPLWPEEVRGTPNSFLRSALFAAIQGKTRKYLKAALLGSQGNYTVKFTGAQLDQADLDTWEQVAHLVKSQPLGNVCMFKGNPFLKKMGRSNGKANYTWLNESLTRLVACAVEIRCDKKVFTGSLVSSFVRDEDTAVYKVTLDPDILKLFGSCDWTSLEWGHRLALKGKPLALWLYGYASSHAAPVPVKVETLRKMSGSQTKEKKHFVAALKKAFEALEKVTGITAEIEGDIVLIHKTPTISQARHLQLKKPPAPR